VWEREIIAARYYAFFTQNTRKDKNREGRACPSFYVHVTAPNVRDEFWWNMNLLSVWVFNSHFRCSGPLVLENVDGAVYLVFSGMLLTSRLRQRLIESVYTAVCGSYGREQLWYADWVTGTADSQCHAKRAMKDMLIAWCSPVVKLCHFSPAMIYNSAINY